MWRGGDSGNVVPRGEQKVIPRRDVCGDEAASNNLAGSRTALGERAQQLRSKIMPGAPGGRR